MTESAPPVVSADWLEARLDEVRVVDVREEWAYSGIGHIPGAVNIPFDAVRRRGADVGMLPGGDHFGDLMSEAGVTAEDRLVAYDDEHGVFAARFLVTALMYGHERWHLLDGDFSAWTRDHESTTEEPQRRSTNYTVRLPEDRPLIDADGVLAGIDDPNTTILDTRSPDEYRDGHIEGAHNLDWRALVDQDTRGLAKESTLESVLKAHGVRPGRQVILYCNTARRISHTYIVLRHLGYADVAFYEGSLTDWRDRGFPLVGESD